jgi:hypothetical protein
VYLPGDRVEVSSNGQALQRWPGRYTHAASGAGQHGAFTTAVPAGLANALQALVYATYTEEGRAGVISLIATLCPR